MHGAELTNPIWIGKVNNDEQQIGIQGFFEGGAKGFHQRFGKVADESHRVGDQHALGAFYRARQIEFSGRGIERGEQFVFCQDAIAFPLSAKGIKQTGFSGVGVTNLRNPWQATTVIAKSAAMGL